MRVNVTQEVTPRRLTIQTLTLLISLSFLSFGCPKKPPKEFRPVYGPNSIELHQSDDVNPVRDQHVVVATVKDAQGNPLSGQRVEWILSKDGVGEIVEVGPSQDSRKIDNQYAVTQTQKEGQALPSSLTGKDEDISVGQGSTWIVITSPVEGTSHIIAYAPGIKDWRKHKAFLEKHWSKIGFDVTPDRINLVGDPHEIRVRVFEVPEGKPLQGYTVEFRLLGDPAGTFAPADRVVTDQNGEAIVVLRQDTPQEGENEIDIRVLPRGDEEGRCCRDLSVTHNARHHKIWKELGLEKESVPEEVEIWQPFEYRIQVSNPSDRTLSDVVITDTLPEGVEAVDDVRRSFSWNLGSLEARSSQTVTLNVRSPRPGRYRNCAQVTAEGSRSVEDCADTVVVGPRLVVVKSGPESAVCENVEYRIMVRNEGNAPAIQVRLEDLFGPEGGTARSVFSQDIGDLAPGQSWEGTVQVEEQGTGTYQNRAVATARLRYSDQALRAEDSLTTVFSAPELVISKTGPDQIAPGQDASYQIQVSNRGDGPAENLKVTDLLPEGFQLVSATPQGYRVEGNQLVWDSLGTLQPQSQLQFGLTLRSALEGGVCRESTARNCAVAESHRLVDGRRSCMREARDCSDTPLLCPALEVVKRGPGVVNCSRLDYEVEVRNTGRLEATNVQLVDTFTPKGNPDRVIFQQAYPVGTLGPGESRTIPIPLGAQARGVYVNRAVATGDLGVRDEAELETIVRKAELKIEKTGPEHVFPGQAEVRFQIEVRNEGDGTAEEVVLVDQVPEGFVPLGPVRWDLGSIEPGQRKSAEARFRVSDSLSGRTEIVNTVSTATPICGDRASGGCRVIVIVPEIDARCQPGCENQTFYVLPQLVARNVVAASTSNVRLFISDRPDGVPLDEPKSWGRVEPNDTMRANFKVLVHKPEPALATTHTFYAVVEAPGGQRFWKEFTCSVPKAELTVSLQADQSEIRAGDKVRYAAVVRNSGGLEQRGVKLRSTLTRGKGEDFDLGDLKPGETKREQWTVETSANYRGTIGNIVTATGSCASASDSTNVVSRVPALLLEMLDDPGVVEVGGITTLTVRVTNQGDRADHRINVKVFIPKRMDYVPGEKTWRLQRFDGSTDVDVDIPDPTQTQETGRQTLTFLTIEQLQPGHMLVYEIKVQAREPGEDRFEVHASSDATGESEDENPVKETESTRIVEKSN